jgi:hypothetical protein
MYPGTQAFMRFVYPCALPAPTWTRALDVARRFLAAVGFDHGLFNMEFFYDPASDRLTVIEFNPRMAAQFSDLYLRVLGIDLHPGVAGTGPRPRSGWRAALPCHGAGVAASFVYRSFDPGTRRPRLPGPPRNTGAGAGVPDALLFCFPQDAGPDRPRFQMAGQLPLRHPASGCSRGPM